jgi:hypothetical protein
MEQSSLVILGSGYSGRFLVPLALRQHKRVFATSRNPDRHLSTLPPDRRIHFDLERPATWTNLPDTADLIWCFPAAPVEQVQAFAMSLGAPPRRIVVLGSTSAYDVGDSREYPPPWIEETAPIDLSRPRVQGEEFLRNECAAIVLRVAGIYGPGRNPLDWIRQGRIGPSVKYVNLIHVEDLASICLAALERGKPGEIYNVSDGVPHTWNEICATAQERWGVTAPTMKEDQSSGKRISNRKTRVQLGYEFLRSDLYAALDQIERVSGESQAGLPKRSSDKVAGESRPET